ncbi:hypothetical protein EB796_001567 [Bugula neritina]|uniref:Uncharacterized protein n=1 Tax=Bugula neritina TaxID=10212 RepID=A0A7J7KPP0_BUGNE|nr:hypothetical protein EB796_001567 [Bugula neritina]
MIRIHINSITSEVFSQSYFCALIETRPIINDGDMPFASSRSMPDSSSQGQWHRKLNVSSVHPYGIYIPSRHLVDRKRHEYPAAWLHPMNHFTEHRECFESWKLDVQSQYLNKQQQLWNSLHRQPYYLRKEGILLTSSIATPNTHQWGISDCVNHFRSYGSRVSSPSSA